MTKGETTDQAIRQLALRLKEQNQILKELAESLRQAVIHMSYSAGLTMGIADLLRERNRNETRDTNRDK